ncbi:hypothetical protein ACXO19_05665 [Lactobacillus delbrueckii subsp. bulgaricus]
MKKYKYIFYYISILYTMGTSLWSGTIYLFMRHNGYSYSLINLFLEIFWLVTFFAEIPSGYIADKFGYLKNHHGQWDHQSLRFDNFGTQSHEFIVDDSQRGLDRAGGFPAIGHHDFLDCQQGR